MDEQNILALPTSYFLLYSYLQLYHSSKPNGMNLARRPSTMQEAKPHEIGRQLEQMAKHEVDIVFCVVPPKSANYAKIKQEAELESGVLTQCIISNTIEKRGTDRKTLSNILLKVNAKITNCHHNWLPSSVILIQSR